MTGYQVAYATLFNSAGDVTVSTVCLPHRLESGPKPFETLASDSQGNEIIQWSYATEAEAMAGHRLIVKTLEGAQANRWALSPKEQVRMVCSNGLFKG